MGFVDLVLHLKEIYDIIKTIKDILKELGIDQKDVNNALQSLKEACEGSLVDAVNEVVEGLTKACEKLISDFTNLFDIMDKDVKEIEKNDNEGAKLLKEALHM